jgi:CDP-glucose 4,6-dehydratase
MKNNFLNYFKGKKVLITGHNGFKGSWISLVLNLSGAKLYGISLKEKKNSLFKKNNLKKIFVKSIYCNINNKKKTEKYIIQINPDILIHMAAQSLVIEGYLNPHKTFMTNLMGTLNVLEASKKASKLKKILITTTDKVYDISKNKVFDENDEIKGVDPYSASKVCVEHLIFSYKKTYFDNHKKNSIILVARSGNVVGGGDYSKNRIIPDILNSIRKNNELKIRAPENIRPWQHVLEPLYGYLLLLSKKKISNNNYIWNFGPDQKNCKKVIDIVKKISKYFKISYKIINNPYKETKTLKLNNNKAKKKLGWKPKLDLDKTISLIIEYENLLSKGNFELDICSKQIKEYFNIKKK